jgi:transcriptional regulator with XRE-family HTH domain
MEVGDAAAQVGVHRNTLWNIERGDTLPNAFDLELMARVYKTSSSTLLNGKAAAPPGSLEYKPQLMRDVLSAVLAELTAQQLQLPPEKVAQLVDLIYEYEVSQFTNSAEAGVKRTTTRFLRLVAA